jgi:Flp pilus assembly pilin Flp
MRLWKQFIAEEQGQDMVEYALVLSLVALIAITAVTTFGGYVNTGWGNLGTDINGKIK